MGPRLAVARLFATLRRAGHVPALMLRQGFAQRVGNAASDTFRPCCSRSPYRLACWAAPGLVAAASAADEPARASPAVRESRAAMLAAPTLGTWSEGIVARRSGRRADWCRLSSEQPAAACSPCSAPAAAAGGRARLLRRAGRGAPQDGARGRVAPRSASRHRGGIEPRSRRARAAPLWAHQAWLTPQDGNAGHAAARRPDDPHRPAPGQRHPPARYVRASLPRGDRAHCPRRRSSSPT